MPKTISVSISPRLAPAEVRARIDSALADLRKQFPQYAGTLRETWVGNELSFEMSAVGQAITGRADVQPDLVHIHVDLPMLVAMLADKIRPRIEAEARKLLSGPGKKN